MDLTQAGRHHGHLAWAPTKHPLEAVRKWGAGRHRRRDADRRIAAGVYLCPDLAWRADELTAPRERRLLARSVRDIVCELSAGALPGASPLNRPAVRPHAAGLVALGDRLADLERPVGAAAILAVRDLLTEPDSPLYARPSFDERAPDIGAELAAILDRLEVRP